MITWLKCLFSFHDFKPYIALGVNVNVCEHCGEMKYDEGYKQFRKKFLGKG